MLLRASEHSRLVWVGGWVDGRVTRQQHSPDAIAPVYMCFAPSCVCFHVRHSHLRLQEGLKRYYSQLGRHEALL